jgi:hypothetical protein
MPPLIANSKVLSGLTVPAIFSFQWLANAWNKSMLIP